MLRPVAFPLSTVGLVLLVTSLAHAQSSAPAGRAGAPEAIGFRYDTTGIFPGDARPPTDFDGATGKNMRWKAPLPNFGNASPIVVPTEDGARAFVLCDHGWPLGEGETPALLCFDADTGKPLWRRAIDPLDTLPDAEAEPLRAARHAFWRHQHEAGRLHHRFHFEAKTDEQREAIRRQAAQHIPDLGHNKPVGKYFTTKNTARRLHWYAAMNHPDCAVLRGRGIGGGLLGVFSWGFTGIGQAMCTPVSDGEAVYVLTGLRTVTKFDFDGNIMWHVWEKDAELTKFYECWLANALRILPVTINGQARRLLVMEYLEHLWAYDCATGRLVWKTPTSGRGGHVAGTPQLLRLSRGDGGKELLVVTRSGHVIRARDGMALAENMLNVNYHGPLGDGRDRLWIKQIGGDGGHFHPLEGSDFPNKCVAGLRFRLEGEKLAYDKFFYDEKDLRRPIPSWLGFVRGEELVTKQLARVAAANGKTIGKSPRGYDAYHGSILAGGHFYGVPKMMALEDAPGRARPGRGPDVDARMVCNVARDGDPITFVGARTVEIIKANPEDPAERDQRMALTGRVYPGEWYCWHAAYVAPFAYKDRLYVRSFDNLYCFEQPSGSSR